MSKDKAEEKEIINAPKKIYLQIGCKDYDCTIDFKELSDVTWSVDKIDSDDIEYVLSTENAKLRDALREILDTQFNSDMSHFNAMQKAKQLLTDNTKEDEKD